MAPNVGLVHKSELSKTVKVNLEAAFLACDALSKGQNPLHQFPRSKSTTGPQHKRQVRNKLARAKVRCVCCVVSFPKFHHNDLLRTCWPAVSPTSPQQVRNKLAAYPSLRGSFGETCVMDFRHKKRDIAALMLFIRSTQL